MKCQFRTWRLDDAQSLSKLISNKKVLDNLRDGIPYPYTEKDAVDYILSVMSPDNQTFAYAIVNGEELIGSVGITRCANIHNQTAELGYFIGEQYWGQGYTTCAVKQVCESIFKHTDIMRIFAEPFAYNTASCRVLEKAGFQYEGTLRKNAVKNGQVLDMKMYALLKEDK